MGGFLGDLGDFFVNMTQASQPFLTQMAGVGAFGGASFDNQQQYLQLAAQGKVPAVPPGGGYMNVPPTGGYGSPSGMGGNVYTPPGSSGYTGVAGGASGYTYQGEPGKIMGMKQGTAIGVGLAVAVGVALMMMR